MYLFPLYTAIPSRLIPYRNRARKANEKLRRVLLEITQQRREAILKGEGPKEDEQEDLLSMMIRASLPQQQRHDAAQPYLTNGELVANLSVFFVAGNSERWKSLLFDADSMMHVVNTRPRNNCECNSQYALLSSGQP